MGCAAPRRLLRPYAFKVFMSTQSLCEEAIGFHQKGNLTEAESRYRRVLAAVPARRADLTWRGIGRVVMGWIACQTPPI